MKIALPKFNNWNPEGHDDSKKKSPFFHGSQSNVFWGCFFFRSVENISTFTAPSCANILVPKALEKSSIHRWYLWGPQKSSKKIWMEGANGKTIFLTNVPL